MSVYTMNISHLSNQHIQEHIGARFLAARLNKNMTQEELANRSGVSEKTLSNLEKGKKSVGLLNIIAIMRALNLLDQLDSFMPEPPPRAASLLDNKSKQRPQRRRASNKQSQSSAAKNPSWSWAEDQTNE